MSGAVREVAPSDRVYVCERQLQQTSTLPERITPSHLIRVRQSKSAEGPNLEIFIQTPSRTEGSYNVTSAQSVGQHSLVE